MGRLTVAGMAAMVVAGGLASAGGVRFAAQPTAKTVGEKVEISFAVSAPTDVTVAIVDARGEVVRHLAAGAVGGDRPSPPPLAKGLAQNLTWDRTDDAGKPAGDGPFTVRVGLGLSAKFDRIFGWSGQNIDCPRGMVCGPDGTLYAIHGSSVSGHRQTTLITAHDRNGRYLRQVFPGPANLPPEKRKGWPRMKLSGGEDVPVVFNQLSRSTYPGVVLAGRIFPVATEDGRLIVLSALHGGGIKHPDVRGGRRLLTIGCDGSVPQNFLGPVIFPGNLLEGFGHLALSPDEKTVYIGGLFERGRKGKGLCQVVWRTSLDDPGKPEVFAGALYQAGKGADGLNDPQGLATDKDGNLYVADYGNDRIAIFDADGKYLDEIPVKHPDQVRVHRKTGAIYVMCLEERTKAITDGHYFVSGHNWKMNRVVKFGGLTDTTEKASFARPRKSRYGGGALLVLDDSGKEPVLWLCDPSYGRRDVFRIVDRGETLESTGDPIRGGIKEYTFFSFINDVAVAGEKMICRDRGTHGWHSRHALVFDINTGAPLGQFVPKGANGKPENVYGVRCGVWVTDPRGEHLYIDCSEQSGLLRRYKVSGEPAPFSSFGSHTTKTPPYAERHIQNTTCFVTREGDIYHFVKSDEGQAGDKTVLQMRIIAPDGRIKNDCLVGVQAARVGGLCVDSRGNVYLGAQVSRRGERMPSWCKGRLPRDSTCVTAAYSQYGAIVKFPPTGGKIALDPNGEYVAHRQQANTVSVSGRLIARGGLLPGKYGRTGAGCSCETTRFDIDRFDRLFVPDPLRFSVGVLDSAGNEIARFGAYGNMDSRGPKSPVPTPEIAFGWPISVECAGGRVFVADLVNRRVVAVKMDTQVEAECPVP